MLHTSLMQRMTDVLSRMLNDPATRAALSGGGEDSLEGVGDQQEDGSQNIAENVENSNEVNNERVSDGVVSPERAAEPGEKIVFEIFAFYFHSILCLYFVDFFL